MSIDIAIQNVGEYYAAHYLSDKNGFLKDINDQTKIWKEIGSQSTPKKLQSLGEAYFKAKTRALDFTTPEHRLKANDAVFECWHPKLLDALGYIMEPVSIELTSEKQMLPATLKLFRNNQPWLVILETPFCLACGETDEEPLEVPIFGKKDKTEWPYFQGEWENGIATLFKQEDRPRWVMLLTGSRIYLFDAHTFAQARYLYIDLEEAYGRKDNKTFEAIGALLSRETLSPETESESVIHEKLREGSLKSTHGVSDQLQGAVREAIEAIANGWVQARIAKKQGYRQLTEGKEPALPDGSWEITPEQLQHEALIYVYRILFCLYAEARGGELGILPISDDVYRLGYSIESLRDLADRGEPGTQAENGFYYAEHLNRLFQLINKGFHPEKDTKAIGKKKQEKDHWSMKPAPRQMTFFDGVESNNQLHFDADQSQTILDNDPAYLKTFIVQPLTATLFDSEVTPLLNRVKLSNQVLHQVMRRLSLGRGDKGKQIGRINYAELGIVQLGAVYEGLLSYKGFFAKEDLIQVLQAPKKTKSNQPLVYDNAIDPKQPTWFVPVSRMEDFKPGEIVIEHRTKQTRIYKLGEFILHLNGMDRVNSASYYTPEVLTRTLIKEALKERLKDFGPEQADEILSLKICEPAMGSAAFLVEAINQLAHEYLRLKQEQVQKTGKKGIDPGKYEDELRRVQHYIAVHNVYGVDLNPTAVELGALSLWLASIHRLKVKSGDNGKPDVYQPGATPWFGLRLRAGNSLIGARRAVWTEGQLKTGLFFGKNQETPRQLKPGESRQANEVYHFLVWDEDMAPAARDKLMKKYWKEDCDKINEWQRLEVKQKWTVEQIAQAKKISRKIDELWDEYAIARVDGLNKTQCTASVWPEPLDLRQGASLVQQEQIKTTLESQSGAFQRLKLLMDSWCAFYFWPLEHSEVLPTKEAWLASAELLLGSMLWESSIEREMIKLKLGDTFDMEHLYQISQNHLPDTKQLGAAVPWYHIGIEAGCQQNFHHWELVYTEILGPTFKDQKYSPKGFDLMFGNPPWIKVTWNDAPLLTEFEPLLGVKDAKSAKFNSERPKLLKNEERKVNYRDRFEQEEGSSMFLNDKTLYPALAGVQTNLYKNFIERSWDLLGIFGKAGLLHPQNTFDDPNGGNFRGQYLNRLKLHLHFKNELLLFKDVDHTRDFCINIYKYQPGKVDFQAIFNIFDPRTIEFSRSHTRKSEIVPSIKDNNGKWEVKGHKQRIINISEKELDLFYRLFEDEKANPSQARIPQIHSLPILKVLSLLADTPKRICNLNNSYIIVEMFHESNAQEKGVITRHEHPSYQAQGTGDWIISGPHFYVANAFNKTAKTECFGKKGADFDKIDLEHIRENYLPKCIYSPGDKKQNLLSFNNSISEWPNISNKPMSKIKRPFFWPINEDQLPAYEIILGEKVNLYGEDISKPGAKTARKFGFFSTWKGSVEDAIAEIKANDNNKSENFHIKFKEIVLTQAKPSKEELKKTPRPTTSYPKLAFRAMCRSGAERSLISALTPSGAGAINSARFAIFIDFRRTFPT